MIVATALLFLAGLAVILIVQPARQITFTLVAAGLHYLVAGLRQVRNHAPGWLLTIANACEQIGRGAYQWICRITGFLLIVIVITLLLAAGTIWFHFWTPLAWFLVLWAFVLGVGYFFWSAIPFVRNWGSRAVLGRWALVLALIAAFLLASPTRAILESGLERLSSVIFSLDGHLDPDSPAEMEELERGLRVKTIKGKIAKYEGMINALEPKAERGDLEIDDLQELKEKREEIVKLNQELKNLDSGPENPTPNASGTRSGESTKAPSIWSYWWASILVGVITVWIAYLLWKRNFGGALALAAAAIIAFAVADHSLKAQSVKADHRRLTQFESRVSVRDGIATATITPQNPVLRLVDDAGEILRIGNGKMVKIRGQGQIQVGRKIYDLFGDPYNGYASLDLCAIHPDQGTRCFDLHPKSQFRVFFPAKDAGIATLRLQGVSDECSRVSCGGAFVVEIENIEKK